MALPYLNESQKLTQSQVMYRAISMNSLPYLDSMEDDCGLRRF